MWVSFDGCGVVISTMSKRPFQTERLDRANRQAIAAARADGGVDGKLIGAAKSGLEPDRANGADILTSPAGDAGEGEAMIGDLKPRTIGRAHASEEDIPAGN